VSRVDRLLENYVGLIGVPWRADAAPMQRVMFCVYPKEEELRLRRKVEEFRLKTVQAGHPMHVFDVSNTFAEWLAAQKYARGYFERPEHIDSLSSRYQTHITESFQQFLRDHESGPDAVVALLGVGMLFGLLKVKAVVDALAPLVPGRLVIFFPGSYENQNYRLLDAYDGWNYLAVPITSEPDSGWSVA
jgi:hypothetical protein